MSCKEAVPTADICDSLPSAWKIAWKPLDREKILHDILAGIIALRPHIGTDSFMQSWEKALAFRGEQVQVEREASRLSRQGHRVGIRRQLEIE